MIFSNENGQQYLQRLKNVEIPDATFPSADPSLVLRKSKNSYVWDVDGNRYLDLCCGFAVHALGHNADVLQNCIRHSIDQQDILHGMGDVYPSKDKVLFCEDLLGLFEGLFARVSLCLTGSQAIEIAMKTVLLHEPHAGFIHFSGAYHGLDLGGLSLCGMEKFQKPFASMLPQKAAVAIPYSVTSLKDNIVQAMQTLTDRGLVPKAIFVEPIQGRSGAVVPEPTFLDELHSAAQELGLLQVYDEIFVGLGRAGELSFARPNRCPDLLCLGKSLGGGLPLAACLARDGVFDVWPQSEGEALHTGTFFGHPLSCRLGSLFLKELTRLDLAVRAKELGHQAVKYLNERLGEGRHGIHVRGQGLMLGIDLGQAGLGAKIANQLRKKGILVLPCGERGEGIGLTPALVIDEQLFDRGLEKICDTICA